MKSKQRAENTKMKKQYLNKTGIPMLMGVEALMQGHYAAQLVPALLVPLT